MRTTIVRKRYGGRWATAAVPAGGGGRAWNGVYTKSKALFTGLTFKREIVHRNICNKILCRSERIKREKKKKHNRPPDPPPHTAKRIIYSRPPPRDECVPVRVSTKTRFPCSRAPAIIFYPPSVLAHTRNQIQPRERSAAEGRANLILLPRENIQITCLFVRSGIVSIEINRE